MDLEKNNKDTYEKIILISKKVNAFLDNETISKNKIKLESYKEKIEKLISKIEKAEEQKAKTNTKTTEEPSIIEEKDNNEEEEKNYNPYSEKFYYKDRLAELDNDVESLIKELEEEDKLGYRNAFVIEKIKSYRNQNIIASREEKGRFAFLINKIKKFFTFHK